METRYVSPIVEVLEIQVEKGFAGSVVLPDVNDDGQAYGIFTDFE